MIFLLITRRISVRTRTCAIRRQTSFIYWVHLSYVPLEDGDRIRSPKRCVLIKRRQWIMFKIMVDILINNRHKPIDLTNLTKLNLTFLKPTLCCRRKPLGMHSDGQYSILLNSAAIVSINGSRKGTEICSANMNSRILLFRRLMMSIVVLYWTLSSGNLNVYQSDCVELKWDDWSLEFFYIITFSIRAIILPRNLYLLKSGENKFILTYRSIFGIKEGKLILTLLYTRILRMHSLPCWMSGKISS